MDYYEDQLKAVYADLKAAAGKAGDDLKNAPQGHLLCHSQEGRKYYRQAIVTEDGYCRVGINHDPELIAQLARKEYSVFMYEAAKKNVHLLREMLMRYQPMDPAVIIAGMGRAARSLPEQVILGGKRNTRRGPV